MGVMGVVLGTMVRGVSHDFVGISPHPFGLTPLSGGHSWWRCSSSSMVRLPHRPRLQREHTGNHGPPLGLLGTTLGMVVAYLDPRRGNGKCYPHVESMGNLTYPYRPLHWPHRGVVLCQKVFYPITCRSSVAL